VSDPPDAEVLALAALRHPDLPVAEVDGPAGEVTLLSDHRHDLVVQHFEGVVARLTGNLLGRCDEFNRRLNASRPNCENSSVGSPPACCRS